jgi:Na+-driven multidrug efflux pump
VTARFAVLALPLVAAAFVVRSVLSLALRTRAPRAAAAIDRWWVWAPLVVILVAIFVVNPLAGVVATIAMGVFLTSSRAVGSPFRPRR